MSRSYLVPSLQSFASQNEYEAFIKELLAHRDNDWFNRLHRPMIRINVETQSAVIGQLCVELINSDPKTQAILQHLNEQSARIVQTLEKMQRSLQPIFEETMDGHIVLDMNKEQ